MSRLVPEKRFDRNGRLVTKHVRSAVVEKALTALPSPTITGATTNLPASMTEPRAWTGEWYRKYPDGNLKKVCTTNFKYHGFKFQCSDLEAYDVLRVSHGANAFLLLDEGIRSKDEAVAFYKQHDLDHLIEDNDEWVDQVIERKIPAQTTLEMAGSFGSHSYREYPQFLDALEANGIRVLRDIPAHPWSVPELIMRDQISYGDIKVIGATRLAKGQRKGPVIDQLKRMHTGTSTFDAEALKQLIIKYEGHNEHRYMDPITMAGYYGADTVSNLRYFHRAADFMSEFQKKRYSREDSAALLTYNDDFYHHGSGRVDYSNDDVIVLWESGADVKESIKKMQLGQTPLQIAAQEQEVPASVSSGWL